MVRMFCAARWSETVLEVGVLQLAVLAGARHLRLRVLDLGLVVRELGGERRDRRLEVLDGRPEVAELVLRDGRLLLVLREPLHAEVPMLHLVLLLLLELGHHVVDRLLHLLEGIELRHRRTAQERRFTAAFCVKPMVLPKSSCASSELRKAMV